MATAQLRGAYLQRTSRQSKQMQLYTGTMMISCENHDYIEIACMYRYPVKLTLNSGALIEGVAVDTQRNESKEECIALKSEDGDRLLVVLEDIVKLQVSVKNPHFSEVLF